MKKIIFLFCLIIGNHMSAMNRVVIPPPPDEVMRVGEILIKFNKDIVDLFNGLSPVEQAFAAMIYQASIPWYQFATDQIHRCGEPIIQLLIDILKNRSLLQEHWRDGYLELEGVQTQEDLNNLFNQINILFTYVFANNGLYFLKEHANSKRTPQRLGLTLVTPENMYALLFSIPREVSGFYVQEIIESKDRWKALVSVLFDDDFEPTLTADGSIDLSAVNIYEKDAPWGSSWGNFTDEHYKKFLSCKRNYNPLISQFYVTSSGDPDCDSFVENYSEELEITICWLKKALVLVIDNADYFDQHLMDSLCHLINFLQSGDQEDYDQYMISWLKTKSRVGFEVGWTEVYYDPMGNVGFPQAEVTITDPEADLSEMIGVLPEIEALLPFPQEFKRDVLGSKAAFPNAEVRRQLFGIGGLGPLSITAAYCLPNDPKIRSEHGTRQVIYPPGKGIQREVDNDLTNKLMFLPERTAWFLKHDPQASILRTMWNVHVTLHETLGHGSGRLYKHTFVEGDELIINGIEYALGDQMMLDQTSCSKLLRGYASAMEEMRAEIISLYVSIMHLDKVKEAGLLSGWEKRLSDQELKEWLLFDMAHTAINRILQQADGATEITGAHALANCAITNYLIEQGGLSYETSKIDVDGNVHDVVGIKIVDFDRALAGVTTLMQEVQRIKSTADGAAAEQLIDTYGKPLNLDFMSILKANRQVISGDLKVTMIIPPHLEPRKDDSGLWTVEASWPENCQMLADLWVNEDNDSSGSD